MTFIYTYPRAYKFHGVSRFIDDHCTINDDGELSSSYKHVHPKQLKLKLETQGEHATFFDLDITISGNIFLYKLFDKMDNFPFLIVRMLHLSSNIP